MANPIVIAAALSRMVAIKCPYCKHKKLVVRKPARFRVCSNCKKQFADPLSARRKK